METTTVYSGCLGSYWGLYWDNGKENGNYYSIFGFRVPIQTSATVFLGFGEKECLPGSIMAPTEEATGLSCRAR